MAKERGDKTEGAGEDYKALAPLFDLAQQMSGVLGEVLAARNVLERVLSYRQDIGGLDKKQQALSADVRSLTAALQDAQRAHETFKAERAAEIAALQRARLDEQEALEREKKARAEQSVADQQAIEADHAEEYQRLLGVRARVTGEIVELEARKRELEQGLDALVAAASKR